MAKCVMCSRPVCGTCRRLVGNRNYCPYCAPAAQFGPWQQHGYPAAMPAGATPKRKIVFPGATWGIGEAIIIFALAFVFASASSFLLYQIMTEAGATLAGLVVLIFLSSLILYFFLLGGTYISVKVRHDSNLQAIGLTTTGLGKGVALGIGLGIPLYIGAMILTYLYVQLFGPSKTDYLSRSLEEASSGTVNPGLMILFVFTLVVLAPICEEIFFRGYMYPALRNRMGMQPAMILNGILFAAAHFDLVGFLPRLLLGYGLCYLFERNHTLAGPITGHALYNGLIVLLSFVFSIFV